jgi:serine/threonine-protein kinase
VVDRIGEYDVFPAFARGGMASVHVGRLRRSQGFVKLVAIKRLAPAFVRSDRHRAMLLEEARICARIDSPYVVPVLDVLTEKTEVCLVMDLVRGVTLATLLTSARGGRIPPRIVTAIFSDVLRGLHAAHEARDVGGRALGILHRDVSPQT